MWMTNATEGRRQILLHYLLAVAVVAGAVAIRLALAGIMGSTEAFLTFFPAVMVAAGFGGVGPGVLASVLSFLAAEYFIIPPLHSLRITNTPDMAAAVVFGVVSLFLSVLNERFRRLRARSEERLQQLITETAKRERSDEMLHITLNFAGVATWVWDVTEDIVTWSGPIEEMVGTPRVKSYADYIEIVLPEDRESLAKKVSDSVAEGREFKAEYRIVHGSGGVRWISSFGDASRDASGRCVRMAGVSLDITERKIFDQKLKASEQHFRELAEAMPQVVWTADGGGDFEYYNHKWYRLTGLPEDSISQQDDWQSVLHPDDFGPWTASWSKAQKERREYAIEFRFCDVNRRLYRWHLGRAEPVLDSTGNVVRWFGTCTDINEQKEQNTRLEKEVLLRTSSLQESLQQLKEREDRLRQALTEKETLLKEIHHRVKNNLQVISSLLRMQASVLQDRKAKDALEDSQRRVRSMALIHERLYGSELLDRVDFADYAKTLVNDLFVSYANRPQQVNSRLEISRVLLDIDQAIPCGLILNELVTNALKYAYPNGEVGEITVRLEEENESGRISFSVSDKGIGLPEGFDWRNSTSTGLPIVEILVKQIGGELSVQSRPGTAFTVSFPREMQQTAAGE